MKEDEWLQSNMYSFLPELAADGLMEEQPEGWRV